MNYIGAVEPSVNNQSVDIHKHEETERVYSFFFQSAAYRSKINQKPHEVHYISLQFENTEWIRDISLTQSKTENKGNTYTHTIQSP